MFNLRTLLTTAASALVLLCGSAVQARTLVLEGSEATTFHGAQPGGVEYTTQLISFLREGSPKPVAAFSTTGTTMASAPAGSVVYLNDLSTLSIADYSAVYILSPFSCCDDNRTGAAVYGAQISAFYAAGGSVAIQDYQGRDWSFVDPILNTPTAGAVQGYNTGFGGATCTDNEIVNADGLLKGFTQPPPLGCWGHQAYSNDYFGALGFISLVDSAAGDYDFSSFGSKGGSMLLALGGALGTPGCTDPRGCSTIPEPASLALVSLSVLGAGIAGRRRGLRVVAGK